MEEKKEEQRITPRYLLPSDTSLFKGRLGSIHCLLDNKEAYANVHCVLCFLISHPVRYISICYSDDNGKEHEIGIIEDLSAFPKEVQLIVTENLKRYYYERIIKRIYSTKFDYGMLFFEVETSEGRDTFQMRWQADRALEFGKKGKLLLDVFENRYIVPSIDDLPEADRNRLTRFIYW